MSLPRKDRKELNAIIDNVRDVWSEEVFNSYKELTGDCQIENITWYCKGLIHAFSIMELYSKKGRKLSRKTEMEILGIIEERAKEIEDHLAEYQY